MTKTVTKVAMLSAAVVLLSWDIYAAVNSTKGDTISELQRTWAWNWPTLPYAWGVVLGHLFWNVKTLRNKWRNIKVLWGTSIAVLLVDVFWVNDIMPIIPALGGIVLGRILWPQEKPA